MFHRQNVCFFQMMFLLLSADCECPLLLLLLLQGKNGKVLLNKRQLQLLSGKTSAIDMQFLEVSACDASTSYYFVLPQHLFIILPCPLFLDHSTCGKIPVGQMSAGMTSCQFFMT